MLNTSNTTAQITVNGGQRSLANLKMVSDLITELNLDSRKVAMAILIKCHTSVSNIWIAGRLGMGHDRSVSRLINQGKTDVTTQMQCKELEEMLQCED